MNRELYKNQTYWIAILGIFSATLLFLESFVIGILLTGIVLGFPLAVELYQEYKNKLPAINRESDITDGILLGFTERKVEIRLHLESLNHMFVIGMTRYGKTRLVFSLVTEFIRNYSPEEVKLAFSDAKAVSFNVFGRSQHLFAPIAKSEQETERLIELTLEEMFRRLSLFQNYHEKICTNIDEYYLLSNERLPRIIVIFDEVADSVEMNSQAEKNLTTLAKMGLAAGIHLALITQRPTKQGISHEITSQCQTVMSTYMKNQVEYGSVAKIPQKVYTKMRPEKGLFMVFSPDLAKTFSDIEGEYEGWGFLRSNYINDKRVEEIAKKDSTENLDLPSLEDSLPAWGGSEQHKIGAIEALEEKLGIVTTKDLKKYFGVGHRTAKTWLEKYTELKK